MLIQRKQEYYSAKWINCCKRASIPPGTIFSTEFDVKLGHPFKLLAVSTLHYWAPGYFDIIEEQKVKEL